MNYLYILHAGYWNKVTVLKISTHKCNDVIVPKIIIQESYTYMLDNETF